MSNVLKVAAVSAGAAAAETDPNFNQTVLLLHGDGTNGAQNNTFLDSSTNNFTITRNGNTTQGTFSPFSVGAGEWSNYFDTSGDSLTVPYGSTLALGTGDCTIEAWVYLISYPQQFNNIVDVRESSVSYSNNAISFGVENDGTFNFYAGSYSPSTHVLETASGKVSLNTWVHLALTRSSGTTKLYVNGVEEASSANAWNQTSGTATTLYIGNAVVARQVNGYISNLRIIKGTAVTPPSGGPTSPLTAVSNTALLTCQSNRFVDNSTNAFAITHNGDVRVTPFSPFAPSAAYDPAVNGGSGYFDGSGDYLTVANTTALDLPGDFTVEFSVYLNSTADQTFIAKWAASNYAWVIQLFSGSLRFFPGNSGTITATSWSFAWSPTISQWYTIALTRSSGSVRAYINGAQIGSTVTETRNLTSTSLTSIGINLDGGGIQPINGYISNLRVLKGQALYTGATYTIPNAPLTTTGYGSTSQSITGTISLLLNFTNAGIFDNTGKNNLETVGNAQIDTAVKKYGTGSMEFDGTGDRLVFPSTPDLQLGTGNFTIEGWVYRADTNIRGVFQLSGTAGGLQANATTNLALGSDTGAVWRIYANNSGYNSAATWSINTWYHFALVRNSGTTTLYINGTSVISQADTVNYTGQNLCVGGFYDTTYLMNGYIDDLRITKGVARYTANFTAPTKAFADQ